MNVLIALAVFFILGIIILQIFKERFMLWWDDVVVHETVTTTTVHNHEPEYAIVGDLNIMYDDITLQPYVIDPVDLARWNLNTNDNMYEDAAGKIWRLV